MLNNKTSIFLLLGISIPMLAAAESGAEKQRKAKSNTARQIEKILTCETNDMPSKLVPLMYKLNGHNTFNRRDSFIGEYTFLPETLFVFNQPIERVYISKYIGELNKDYYQYTTVLPESVNPSMLAEYAGVEFNSWNGRYAKNGNSKIQLNFQNGQVTISCLQPILSFKATARPSAEGDQVPSYSTN